MSKSMKFTVFAAAFIVLTGFFMSCNQLSEKELGLESQGMGTVVFKITDAPFPADLVAEANVTIDWIKLLKYPAEEPESEGSENDEFILVELDESATFNLLELRNGLTDVMAKMDVPVGAYSEIRLHIVDAGILLKDGAEFNLKVPGGDASGLKIKLDPALDVVEGTEVEVLVDFDLSRSFVMQGNPRNIMGFIFKPVVRAVANVETSTGEISGVVADEDGNAVIGASILLYDDEEMITSAISSEEGFYSIIGIPPGDYTLVLEVDEYTAEVDIIVEEATTTETNFLIGITPSAQENTDDESTVE